MLAGVAEQNGTGRHQILPGSPTVMKRTGRDDSYGKAGVPLFKRQVLRAGRADHVRNGPSAALRENVRSWRNFSQELALTPAYSSSMTTFEDALIAQDRCSEIPLSADIYGWLIGSWDLDVLRFGADGREHRLTGEVHFARALEGRAIEDIWIMPRSSERRGDLGREFNTYGMTLRVWDPSIEAWRVTWINPVSGARDELVGKRCGKDLVQIGTHADGTPIRWIFSEITPDSFLWTGEALEADGKTWRLEAEFRAQRMN
jgi:hypothetical protein